MDHPIFDKKKTDFKNTLNFDAIHDEKLDRDETSTVVVTQKMLERGVSF